MAVNAHIAAQRYLHETLCNGHARPNYIQNSCINLREFVLTHVFLAPGAYRGGPDGPVPYPFPGPTSREFTRLHATSHEFTRLHANSRRHDVFAREGLQKLKICSSCSVGSTLFSCFSCSMGSTFSCFLQHLCSKTVEKKHAFYL